MFFFLPFPSANLEIWQPMTSYQTTSLNNILVVSCKLFIRAPNGFLFFFSLKNKDIYFFASDKQCFVSFFSEILKILEPSFVVTLQEYLSIDKPSSFCTPDGIVTPLHLIFASDLRSEMYQQSMWHRHTHLSVLPGVNSLSFYHRGDTDEEPVWRLFCALKLSWLNATQPVVA